MSAGRAWRFGDRIDTDVLAPGPYMKLAPEAMARHCLEAVRPEFAAEAKPGDFIVAGSSFGIGSSREQAARSLKLLGIRAVLAVSFGRIFWRNALNLGLPALVMPDAEAVGDGDRLTLDLRGAEVANLDSGTRHAVQALPPQLLAIVEADGLVPYLKRRYAATSASALTQAESR